MKQRSRSLSRARGEHCWSNELDKNLEVSGVKILSVFDPLGRLQNHGQIAKTGIVDEVSKRFKPHSPHANSRVAIDPATPFTETVIQMPHTQVF